MVCNLYAVLWTDSPENHWYLLGFNGEYYPPTRVETKTDGFDGSTYLKMEANRTVYCMDKYTITLIQSNVPWSATHSRDRNNEEVGINLSASAIADEPEFAKEARDWIDVLGNECFSF